MPKKITPMILFVFIGCLYLAKAYADNNSGSIEDKFTTPKVYLHVNPPDGIYDVYRDFRYTRGQFISSVKLTYGKNPESILYQVHSQLVNLALVTPRKYCVDIVNSPFGQPLPASPLIRISLANIAAIFLVYPDLKIEMQKEFLKFIKNTDSCPGERFTFYSFWYWLMTLPENQQGEILLPTEDQLPPDVIMVHQILNRPVPIPNVIPGRVRN